METFKKAVKLLKNNYWLFLILVVTLSYGQILEMYVWKDDNALFFKFDHINEAIGFFGTGLIGDGLYRFLVLPHWLIYKVFGTQQIWPYYANAFIFYILATLSIYKLFSQIFSRFVGKVAGFLFAAGYIASEGFLWLNESLLHSLSTIFVCWTLIFYHQFGQTRQRSFYLLSIISYFLAVFVVQSRSHYLVGVVVLFDLLWLVPKISLSRLASWILRSLPFGLIFYYFYIRGFDTRALSLADYFKAILSGQFYYLYSFFGTIGNLFVPDIEQNWFLTHLSDRFHHPHPWLALELMMVVVLAGVIWLSLKRSLKSWWVSGAFLIVSLGWVVAASAISNSPEVNPSLAGNLSVFLGGLSLILVLTCFMVAKIQAKKQIFFLMAWMIGNLYGYISFIPVGEFSSYERYLAHSFIPLVGLLALLAFYKRSRWVLILVITWGVINILNSVTYQYDIVQNRSNQARLFYTQLESYLPILKKGDVVYIEIADNAVAFYRSAFGVGSMPETTALAWRYKLDRNDIYLVNSYDELKALIAKNHLSADQVHSYFLSTLGLTDTTDLIRPRLWSNYSAQTILLNNTDGSLLSEATQSAHTYSQSDLFIDLKTPIVSVTPIELTINLTARPLVFSDTGFPYQKADADPSLTLIKDSKLQQLAIDYGNDKKLEQSQAIFSSSSQWQDRITANVYDGDLTTAWEADRFKWTSASQYLQIDLSQVENVNRLVWINAFSNNVPTDYTILTSLDGQNWQTVKTVQLVKRVDDSAPQVVEFPDQSARFVRMLVNKTISQDAPAISEIWVVKTKYKDLDINQTEQYLKSPFEFISNQDSFDRLFVISNGIGSVQLQWMSDTHQGWFANSSSFLPISYDGQLHSYKLILPAGGVFIKQLKLTNVQIPGALKVEAIEARSLPLNP